MIAAARAGTGAGLVVTGEPGIGKSALLAYAGQRAADARVLRAAGTEAESALAFSALHQLLYPVLDRVPRLPEPQSGALGAALGLAAGGTFDRFLVAVATLTLLSDLAAERPVVCLVDDLQWVDRASAEVLAFVARRLVHEPVALFAAVRSGEDGDPVTGAGLDELRLTGLPAAEAGELLGDRPVPPGVRDRLVAATGGNPLALIEVPGTLTDRQLAGYDPLPDPLPLAGELEQVFAARLGAYGPGARTLALLCAAEGPGHLAVIRRAARSLGVDPAPLETGELAELVRADGPAVAFPHPLMRSAVYHGASPADRRAAHAALADAHTDDAGADRRAWHRAQAATGPDEAVAAELADAAGRTLRRSGHVAAAAALERAAGLSPSAAARAHRLAGAAEASWLGGDTARARDLIDRAEREPAAGADRLRLRYLRGTIELRGGVVTDALAILLPAAAEAAETDPRLSLRMLVVAAEAAFHTSDADATREIDRLMARLPAIGDARDDVLVRLFLSVAPISRGERPASLPGDIVRAERLDDPHLLVRAGGVAFAWGDGALARRLRAKGEARARTLGAAGTLAWALWYRANDEMFHGRYARAEALADEGYHLARETAQPNLGWQHRATLTALAAVRGRVEEARRLGDEVITQAGANRLTTAVATARGALGRLELAQGDGPAAVAHLMAMHALMATSHHAVALTVIPDLIEALVRAGDPERGRDLFARYLAPVDDASPAHARALAARARALLCDGPDAGRWFEEALGRHAETDTPLDRARTGLLYGEYLRRDRQRTEARAALRTALETFERLDAAVWLPRTRSELRATGETARRADPDALNRLTPQEVQVAHAVARGATNRATAAQLFISPRTVDDHLRKIYRKLEITSRTELVRLMLDRDTAP